MLAGVPDRSPLCQARRVGESFLTRPSLTEVTHLYLISSYYRAATFVRVF